MSKEVVLLHGFGATHRMWDGVAERLARERYRPLALDLPGHGAAREEPASFARCVELVSEATTGSFVLCGYSMGARAALHAALALGDRVARLVLVSASAGLEDPAARAARARADEQLAARIESAPIEKFISEWQKLELFARDGAALLRAVAADQRRNDPRALARALRGIGAGASAPLWDRLGELRMPAAVLAGSRDKRYCELAARLAGAIPRARVEIVADAGHRVPLEAPQAVVQACRG